MLHEVPYKIMNSELVNSESVSQYKHLLNIHQNEGPNVNGKHPESVTHLVQGPVLKLPGLRPLHCMKKIIYMYILV
jgi:hypothetical protein